jgi:hypothetical protein
MSPSKRVHEYPFKWREPLRRFASSLQAKSGFAHKESSCCQSYSQPSQGWLKVYAKRAYQIVKVLSAEIGPRLAGSEGEQKALEYAEEILNRCCGRVERMEYKCPRPVSFNPLIAFGAAALIWCGWAFPRHPQAMIEYLVAFFALPRLVRWLRGMRAPSARSYNLIGYAPQPKGAEATLILCAHIDSAWASRVGREWVANLRVALREMWLPSVVALGLLAIVKIAGDHLAWYPLQQPWWLFDPLVVVYAMTFGTLQLAITLLGWSKEVSPGAHDNASGVATVLTLAEHFAQQPPQRLALQYVLFTAEEGGLLGSKAFVKQTPLDERDTYVLNFDMVGSGQRLYYVRGADLFPPRFTDKRLNALLKEIVPDIKSRWYWYGGGSDFHSFLAKGIPATSLQTRGNRRAGSVYHTTGDTIEVIEPDTLERVVNTAVQVIRRLDA